jgi:hypothetical protein
MSGSSPLMSSAQLLAEPTKPAHEETQYDSDQDDKRLFYESCSQAYTKVEPLF